MVVFVSQKYLQTVLKQLKNYNSIQDYFGYKLIHNFTYPKHYNFSNANVCQSLYYSTEHDDYADEDSDFYEFVETIQNDRAAFFSSYNNLCRINGVFDKFYLHQTFKNG